MNLIGDPVLLAQHMMQQMPNIDPTSILAQMNIPLLPADIAMQDIWGVPAGPQDVGHGTPMPGMGQQQKGLNIGQLLAGAQMGTAQPMNIPFAPPPGGAPGGGPQGRVAVGAPGYQRAQMPTLGQLIAMGGR